MITKENFNYAVRNLLNRKLRTSLTILSILVGIATIFIFVSFGVGLYSYIGDISVQMGVDKVMVQAKGVGAPGLDENFQLSEHDLDVFRKTSGIAVAAGMAYGAGKIKEDTKTVYQFLAGLPVNNKDELQLILDLLTVDVLEGRQLGKGDYGKVVLGYSYSVPDRIFPKRLQLGDKIEINDVNLKIVGFMSEIGNPSDDANVYVTEDAYFMLQKKNVVSYGYLVGKVDNVKKIDEIIARAERRLRKSRGVEEGKEDFFITSFQQYIETFKVVLNVVIGFIALIALISIIVAAVNTLNTMFTSILERTKEIGVLKAIGAKNPEIMNIFLLESGIQGFVAGVIGVLFGWILSSIGGYILNAVGYGFLKPAFNWMIFASLILFATAVGTLSGLLPSYNASRKNPVDSLRYE